MRWMDLAALVLLASTSVAGQAPRPFPVPPRPGSTAAPQEPTQPKPAETPTTAVPSEATLGVPIYPNAQFLVSYDAGRRQRFYLFGAQASFTEIVSYYKTVLKNEGDLIFELPATHTFEVARFRDETMAFPPGVTVKDFRRGGRGAYINPKPGATPANFPTIIQIVPAPPGTAR